MTTSTVFLVARLLHVLAGTLWVGAAVFIAASLAPAIRASGPAGATVMRYLTGVQKVPLILMAIGGVAILSGAYLAWVVSGGSLGPWVHSGPGEGYAFGAASALLAATVGSAINAPAARKLGSLAAQLRDSGGPPTDAQADALQRLNRRLATGTRTAAVLLLLSTVAMATARYVS